MSKRRPPGQIRDAIIDFLGSKPQGASVPEVYQALQRKLGSVAPSSIRSYLQINTPAVFVREARGQYRLKK